MKNTANRITGMFYWICIIFLAIPIFSVLTGDYIREFAHINWDIFTTALRVSLKCSFISMFIVVFVGMPAAYFMANSKMKILSYLEMIFNIPLILPPAVTGLVLLVSFGSRGYIGKYLSVFGINLPFSDVAVILTLVFVSLPIFVKSTSEGLKSVDKDLQTAAQTLGDTPLKVFLRVTLPISKGHIFSGFAMAFARGMAEFGATMMFAGNIKGVTQTLPLAIYSAMETSMPTAMAMSTLMIIFSILILVTVKVATRKAL